ncbi:MAG: hypothetical protein FJ102_18910 [Deltaproteobacteria bacterium]|nr:hypothetical protein [Deltaproteobacteria bacterium]
MAPLVVFGGGLLALAVARAGAARGQAVTLASPQPRVVSGWWRQYPGPRDTLAWMPAGAEAIVAVGPSRSVPVDRAWGEGLSALMSRLDHADRVVLAGPLPGREPSIEIFERVLERWPGPCLRVAPLFGQGDTGAGQWASTLRAGGTVRLGEAPAVRWLAADDAARAILGDLSPGEHLATGGELWTPGDLVDRLVVRFGGRRARPLIGAGLPRDGLARLRAWAGHPDRWDEARWGPRTSLAAWIERLPGPRRRAAG